MTNRIDPLEEASLIACIANEYDKHSCLAALTERPGFAVIEQPLSTQNRLLAVLSDTDNEELS